MLSGATGAKGPSSNGRVSIILLVSHHTVGAFQPAMTAKGSTRRLVRCDTVPGGWESMSRSCPSDESTGREDATSRVFGPSNETNKSAYSGVQKVF